MKTPSELIRQEHQRASRIRRIHMLAGAGLFVWLLLGILPGPPDPLHRAALFAWGLCFLATGVARMEHRWFRRLHLWMIP